MKIKFTYIILLFSLIIIGTWSCERDDICPEDTPTTPHLVIRFYDNTNPNTLKQVRKLAVRGFDAEGIEIETPIFEAKDTDSIVLPLRFQGENISTTSRFILEKDQDFADDDNPLTSSNTDIITVNYTPEFLYVSRACGYKSIFKNVSIAIQPDADRWIISNQILTTTVDNETQAHIILRH